MVLVFVALCSTTYIIFANAGIGTQEPQPEIVNQR